MVVVVWGLIVGLKTLSAYHHDKRGLAALEQVKADLSPGDLTSAQSTRLLDQAHAEFASAKSELSSPLFAPIRVVPVIGRQYTAVRDLSSAADTVCQVGSSFISEVHGLLERNPTAPGPSGSPPCGGSVPCRCPPSINWPASTPGLRRRWWARWPPSTTSSSNQLYDARVRLTKAAAVSAAVATILQGPQTYLVLAANNAEMRAGSGDVPRRRYGHDVRRLGGPGGLRTVRRPHTCRRER